VPLLVLFASPTLTAPDTPGRRRPSAAGQRRRPAGWLRCDPRRLPGDPGGPLHRPRGSPRPRRCSRAARHRRTVQAVRRLGSGAADLPPARSPPLPSLPQRRPLTGCAAPTTGWARLGRVGPAVNTVTGVTPRTLLTLAAALVRRLFGATPQGRLATTPKPLPSWLGTIGAPCAEPAPRSTPTPKVLVDA
jgi:hypothetical protein